MSLDEKKTTLEWASQEINRLRAREDVLEAQVEAYREALSVAVQVAGAAEVHLDFPKAKDAREDLVSTLAAFREVIERHNEIEGSE